MKDRLSVSQSSIKQAASLFFEYSTHYQRTMGGKEAKERRRLKRLALQQQAEASGSAGGGADAKHDSATPNKSGTSGGDGRQPPAKKMKPTNGNSTSPKQQHGQNGNAKGKFGGGKGKFGGKPSNAGKHKGKGGDKSGQQQQNNNNKKKFKKPKHLKRKLEALSGEGGADEEKERIRLQQQMRQLEESKAERAKRFETKMKSLAGDKFDADVFAELTAKGASKETIRKIIVEGEKIKEKKTKAPKKEGAKIKEATSSNKKQKKMDEVVDTAATEDTKNDEEHETPSESSSDDGSDDSGSDDISLEDIEDISDEECDVYILDPDEVAKKKKTTSQVPNKDKSTENEAGSSSESDDSDSDSDDDKEDVDENSKSEKQGGEMETEKGGDEKSGWSDSDEGDKSSSSSDSDDSSSSSSSDDDSDVEEQDTQQKRTRGRGRKGRKDADNKRETTNAEIQETKKKETEAAAAAKATPVKDKKNRRCIGRKPVTDFIVGQKYDGEVVYVKPFGAFIDIGCHSDAFCHISRVADDFVESIEDVLAPGDKVSPRIVEIDRKQKRLTVSLQSSARIVDEKKSIEDRKERLRKNSAKKTPRDPSSGNRSEGGLRGQHAAERQKKNSGMEIEEPQGEESRGQFDNLEHIPESEMTPAQLKRARKLARRAERRKQQELTGLSA